MDLLTLLGHANQSALKIPREFPVMIERKTLTATMQLDARVKGHFIENRGKADFVALEITVNGAPDMNLRDFFASELKEVTHYALPVEYPKLLGWKA
jgi:hypothetical protein